jgi:hypothetical protein
MNDDLPETVLALTLIIGLAILFALALWIIGSMT